MQKSKLVPITKSKQLQQQANILSNVLAQFDIQTKVNQMVVRSFDTIMRSNKQAFEFIKQNQHKFITFQQRLSKAQTYYKNIQSNVNSKISLTDNMNSRLQQFSVQFWNAMKQNNNDIININKKIQQISTEKRKLQSKFQTCDKQVKILQQKSLNINNKINEEVDKILQTIRNQSQQVNKQFNLRKKQLLSLNQAISNSRALLQSKTEIVSELLIDLKLYKEDRPKIKQQISRIYDQVSQRAFKTQLFDIRTYIDSVMMTQQSRVNQILTRLDTKLKIQEIDRKKQQQIFKNQFKLIKNKINTQIQKIVQLLNNKCNKIYQKIELIQSKFNQQLKIINQQILEIKIKYQTQIPEINIKINENKSSILSQSLRLTSSLNQIQQCSSNILSINQMIDSIIKQNDRRKQQMKSFTSNVQSQGNLSEQVILLFQKVDLLTQNLFKLNSSYDQNKESQQRLNNQLKYQIQKISIKINQKFDNKTMEISQKLMQLDKYTRNQIKSVNILLQQKLLAINKLVNDTINSKIQVIRDQLNQLDKIHLQIKQFKQIFKKQIQQSNAINASVAQKMQRTMSLFTKLKSDTSVKIQNLTSDLQRKTLQLKSSLGDVQQIKKYLSVVNEYINLLLVNSYLIDKNQQKNNFVSNHGAYSFNNNVSDKQIQIKQKQTDNNKSIKIASVLQGWIFQYQQSSQKIKYRGQNFSIKNRIKIIQNFIQYFVKFTEKIKGSILQNGKDMFIKILDGSNLIEQGKYTQRKRLTSRSKKTSELLPKLQF